MTVARRKRNIEKQIAGNMKRKSTKAAINVVSLALWGKEAKYR